MYLCSCVTGACTINSHPVAPDLCPVAEGSVRADHGEEDERWEDEADDTSSGGTGQRQYNLHIGHQESNGERPCNYRDCNEVEDPGWNGLGTGSLLENSTQCIATYHFQFKHSQRTYIHTPKKGLNGFAFYAGT